jgi:putative ABC transport system permease protein
MFRSLPRDFIVSLRQLRRAPGFAIIVIATLALGIGVTTTVYSLVDGALLRPFPLPHPEQLMALFTVSREPAGNIDWHGTSWPDLRDWQTHSHTFSGLAGVFPDYRLVSRENGGGGAVIRVNRVSSNYFDVLKVQPAMGRGFAAEDEQAGHHVAILSYGFWWRVLGGDPHIVGRTIRISDEPYAVIGVMPQGFVEPREETAEVWTSIALYMEGATPPAKIRDDAMAKVVGRLRAGVTAAQARAELSAIQAGLAASFREIHDQNAVEIQTVQEQVGNDVRTPLVLLLAAVFAVLLIVCTNVAGLILTRATRRSGEAALRTALGASQWRVWRQMLIEGLLLGGCGGLLGAALAWGLLNVTLPAIPQDIPRMAEIGMSWRVLFFAAAISLVCAVASSVAPAWKLARVEPVQAVRAQAKQTTDGWTARRLQSALVVVQTMLGVALLIGSGFLIRGFVNLCNAPAGFEADHLFTFQLPLTEAHYPHITRARFYHELIPKLAVIPGVRSASGGFPLPMEGWGQSATVEVDGRPNPPEHKMSTLTGVAEPGFFETLGVPLLRGRLFTAADDDAKAPLVAVVNEAFAKRYFGGQDPVGHMIRPDIRRIRNQAIEMDPQGEAERVVVGVIADTSQESLTEPAEPFAVFPFAQATELMRPQLLMRVAGDPMQYEKAAAALVQGMDPELFLLGPRSMEMLLGLITGTQRFETLLIAGFSTIALFLTSLGFYSMLAAMVTARTREIGVRMALGAARGDVARLIVMRMAVLLGVGATAGGTIAAAALRVVDRSDWGHDLLFRVSWGDPRMIAAFVAVLTLVALGGCLLPTWQATRVDPMRALRSE